MKVAHLVSSSGLYGAERVLLTLASRVGDSVAISLEKPGSVPSVLAQEAVTLNIPFFKVECRGQMDVVAVRQVRAILAGQGIDILHTHNYKSDILGFFAARPLRIPVVATVHGYLSENLKVRIYEFIDRLCLRFFSMVVLVSEGQSQRFRACRTAVIHNGIDVAPDEGIGHENGPLKIGIVGRLSVEKGHQFLIEAFSKFVKDHPDAEVIIAGEGLLRTELEELTASLGVAAKVGFLGFQSDMASFYRNINICVCASLIEHFPMVVLEAMSFGKAVIATKVGSVDRMIRDRETGRLIEPGSVDEIYRALCALADDKGERERLGRNARQFIADHHSAEKMTKFYQRIYQEVMPS
jgi:glycosyltransferase involved in cell wall biosynthesis